MTSHKEELDKALEIARKIRASDGAVCTVYFDEFRKQPGANEALIDVAAKQIPIEVIKYRTPVYGSIVLGKDVAEQAIHKYKNGDIKGAVAAMATATLVTATGAVPLIPGIGWVGMTMPLGDGVVEAARGLGVDIEKSPIHNTYNTVMGTKHMCERLGAMARLADAPTKPINTKNVAAAARDVLLITEEPLSNDEVEAFNRLLKRVVRTHVGISSQGHDESASSQTLPAKRSDVKQQSAKPRP